VCLIPGQRIRCDGCIEGVRFCLPGLERGLERITEGSPQPIGRLVRQPQSDRLTSFRCHGESIVGRCLGAVQFGVDCVLVPVDDGVDDAVLAVRLLIGLIEGPLGIGFIFGEKQIDSAFTVEESFPNNTMPSGDGPHVGAGSEDLQLRFLFPATPRPGVAKPQGGQHVDLGRLGAPVANGDLDQDVFWLDLGVLDENIEVPVVIEYAGVQQFILGGLFVARPVGVDNGLVRVRGLRILVEILHVRMGWRAVEVEVVFLDVLAVITLAVAQSEQPFLEDRIAPVPKRQRETEQLAVIGDAGEPVLTPPVCPVLRVIVGEVIPGVAIGAVIFTHCPPLPLAQIRPPLLPDGSSFAVFLEPGLFRAGFVGLICLHGSLPALSALEVQPGGLCLRRCRRRTRATLPNRDL